MTADNLVTVSFGTTLEQAKELLHRHRIEKLLVVDEDYRCVGLITVKDIEKAQRFPHACKDEQGRLRCLVLHPQTEERLRESLREDEGGHQIAMEPTQVRELVKRIGKAVARSLREAVETDPRKGDAVPSTKGAL